MRVSTDFGEPVSPCTLGPGRHLLAHDGPLGGTARAMLRVAFLPRQRHRRRAGGKDEPGAARDHENMRPPDTRAGWRELRRADSALFAARDTYYAPDYYDPIPTRRYLGDCGTFSQVEPSTMSTDAVPDWMNHE